MSASRQTVLDDFAACGSFDVRERLPELKLPVLLIGGSDDLMVSAKAVSATAEKLARAELRWVTDTGHLTHLEQPEAFLGHLREFLQTVS
jgi:pimeloyl-ACP methyl ester carboxylesterase